MKKVCASCEYCSGLYHELDPLGEWKWCTLHLRDVHEDDEVCENWLEVVLTWPENNKPKKEGENVMRFEPGKHYRHTSGDMIATLDFLETTVWGRTLIVERMFADHYDLYAVGSNDDSYTQNWEESTKEEWMKNFSKDQKGETKMLEDSYGGSESPQTIGKSLERCKPDYETMILRLTEQCQKEEVFRDALLLYFQGRQARKGMAELIGEMVTKCNMLRGQFDALVKQQEEDKT